MIKSTIEFCSSDPCKQVLIKAPTSTPISGSYILTSGLPAGYAEGLVYNSQELDSEGLVLSLHNNGDHHGIVSEDQRRWKVFSYQQGRVKTILAQSQYVNSSDLFSTKMMWEVFDGSGITQWTSGVKVRCTGEIITTDMDLFI